MLHFLHCSFPPPLPRFPFYSSSSVFIVLFCFLNYCLLTEGALGCPCVLSTSERTLYFPSFIL